MLALCQFLHDKYSLAAQTIIYIIDVSGGDKIPRKGGPGITQADLLVKHGVGGFEEIVNHVLQAWAAEEHAVLDKPRCTS
ncbi:unnamed protein product [Musa hybrid cultivar]